MKRTLAWATCYALTMLAFVTLTGCASLEQRANTAAVADGTTTLGALALGAAEANPVGFALAALLKYPLLAYIKTLPEDEQAGGQAVAGAVWGGAAVNNACVIVAILSAGTFAPVCIVAGIGYGVWAWNETTAERDFYAFCAEYRRVSGEAFRCEYRIASL